MTRSYRNILMVYPSFHKTHWGMKYALPILGKQSIMAPLGLITVAALTPPSYDIRLVDLNAEPLKDADLEWADLVCLSSMMAQKKSLFETAKRAKAAGKLVVFGGPYPTTSSQECAPHCDVMILNEGEITWLPFLKDLESGQVQPVYTSEDKPDVTLTPVPRFDLLKVHDYLTIPIQFARGCPFECEFCDIPVILGRKPRTKTPDQVLAELDAIKKTGYRGGVMLVDDNFIGKKNDAKKLLPRVREWNEANGTPYFFSTQVTVTLAEDEELMRLMREANFTGVFMGIETPSMESLNETNKYQNTRRSLLDSVQTVQATGLFVYAGFIVGFDNDKEDIFDRQIDFIRKAGITTPTLGLLYALPGTPLHKRMKDTGRLRPAERTDDLSGYNTNFDTNIITTLPRKTLLEGYRKILATLYQPREYFDRHEIFFSRAPVHGSGAKGIAAFFLIIAAIVTGKIQGPPNPEHPRPTPWRLLREALRQLPRDYKKESLRFFWRMLRTRPDQLPAALMFTLIGIHYQRFTFEDLLPDVDLRLELLKENSSCSNELQPGPVLQGA